MNFHVDSEESIFLSRNKNGTILKIAMQYEDFEYTSWGDLKKYSLNVIP